MSLALRDNDPRNRESNVVNFRFRHELLMNAEHSQILERLKMPDSLIADQSKCPFLADKKWRDRLLVRSRRRRHFGHGHFSNPCC